MTVGVDVGGTFTDVVWWDGGRLRVVKVTTTPDQSDGVVEGVQALVGDHRGDQLLHGTTVATNTLLQRKGARTALVVDAGYEDLIEIGRQDRPTLYDAAVHRPPPLIARDRRVGFGEGLAIEAIIERVADLRPEAVAVSLLRSFVEPDDELRLGEALAAALPGIPVSLSHQVAAEFREFERTSTTVLNAYLQPAVDSYLSLLSRRAFKVADRVLVMRSSGGLTSAAGAAARAASIVLSGPAGGVMAAAALGRAHGWERVISFDMGGTSTDVCRIEGGRPEISGQREIDGVVCRLPTVAVHTIGAGGGSIGWRDPGGALRVGPQSAGAHPGPASYRRGGSEATVTDANLVLGRLSSERALAGGVSLDADLAMDALDRLGAKFGKGPEATAAGVIEVVEAHMERALRVVSIEQGADPREAALVAFGGAGGLHATGLARRLEMSAVLIPPHAGVFSALGLLLSPPRHDVARSVLLREEKAGELDPAITQLLAIASDQYRAEIGVDPSRVKASVDVRYFGQSHETDVSYRIGEGWAQLAERFHGVHAALNGFARPEDAIEAVTIRAVATGRAALSWSDLGQVERLENASPTRRRVFTPAEPVDADVWWRPALIPGQELMGPAVIEEPEATTWIGAAEAARILEDGTIEVRW